MQENKSTSQKKANLSRCCNSTKFNFINLSFLIFLSLKFSGTWKNKMIFLCKSTEKWFSNTNVFYLCKHNDYCKNAIANFKKIVPGPSTATKRFLHFLKIIKLLNSVFFLLENGLDSKKCEYFALSKKIVPPCSKTEEIFKLPIFERIHILFQKKIRGKYDLFLIFRITTTYSVDGAIPFQATDRPPIFAVPFCFRQRPPSLFWIIFR